MTEDIEKNIEEKYQHLRKLATFGERVKQNRMKYELSVRGLANNLDVSPSYVSDIERGLKNPSDKIKWYVLLQIALI